MKPPSPNAHWRDSAKSVRFFMLDGKASFPILLFIMHIKLWTLIVALIFIIFFTSLNRYGLSINAFFRWLRAAIAGRRKVAIPWWME